MMHEDLFMDDDWDGMEQLEEELFPITLTRNEIFFLDDSLTMMIERDNTMEMGLTTMRPVSATGFLPAPVSLIDKIGLALLQVTDPEQIETEAIVHLDTTELYMLREVCFSYSKVGKEQVGFNLKRKFYTALYKNEYDRAIKVNKLLDSIDELIPKEE